MQQVHRLAVPERVRADVRPLERGHRGAGATEVLDQEIARAVPRKGQGLSILQEGRAVIDVTPAGAPSKLACQMWVLDLSCLTSTDETT